MKKKLLRLKRIKLTKRKEFVLITLALTLGFVITQLVGTGIQFYSLGVLTVISYFLSALALREDLKSTEWFTLLILPTLFTLAIGLFYFLLPVRWLTRIPTAVGYALGMYAILLVENIYNVAVNRSIQLLRVAHAIGFVVTLVTLFLLINTVFSFRFPAYANFAIIFLIQLPLVIQSLWSIELTGNIPREVIRYSVFFAFIGAQVALVISFWPLAPILASLFLTLVMYTLIGIGQHYFARRLFRNNIVEYIRVFVIVFFIILLTTRYR